MYDYSQNLWGNAPPPMATQYLDHNRPTAFSRPYGGYSWEQQQPAFGMSFGGAQPVTGASTIQNWGQQPQQQAPAAPRIETSTPGYSRYIMVGSPTTSLDWRQSQYGSGSPFIGRDFRHESGDEIGNRAQSGVLGQQMPTPLAGFTADDKLGPPPDPNDEQAMNAYYDKFDKLSKSAGHIGNVGGAPPAPPVQQSGYTDQQGVYHPGPSDFGTDPAVQKRAWDSYSDDHPPGLQVPPGRAASQAAALQYLAKFKQAAQSGGGNFDILHTVPALRMLAGAEVLRKLYSGYDPAKDPAFVNPTPEDMATVQQLQAYNDTNGNGMPAFGSQQTAHQRPGFLKSFFNFAPPNLSQDPRFSNVQYVGPNPHPGVVQNYVNGYQYEELDPVAGAWQPYVAPQPLNWQPVISGMPSLTRRDLR